MRGLILVASLLAACQAPGDVSLSTSTTQGDDVATTQGASSSEASTGASTFDTSAAESTAADATSSSTTVDDTSTSGTTGSDTTTGGTTGQAIKTCKKVDLLFMIVDRGELWDTDAALNQLMPHLAERLETDFAEWDYHLMVVNSSGTWGDEVCEGACDEGEVCEWDTPYPCDYAPDACDLTLGAGVMFPAGSGASNVRCPIDGGKRYLASGQQDLADTLECVRRVGFGYGYGDVAKHRVARATLDALDGPLNAPGACNAGFFREDAYLILFVLSTIPDFHSDGTPAAWTQELKGHKGGKFDKIYFIGLFQGCDSAFGWKEYEPLNEWVSSLYHHALDDACTGELVPYVDPALDYVLDDCRE